MYLQTVDPVPYLLMPSVEYRTVHVHCGTCLVILLCDNLFFCCLTAGTKKRFQTIIFIFMRTAGIKYNSKLHSIIDRVETRYHFDVVW